jgi:hypothetical protein
LDNLLYLTGDFSLLSVIEYSEKKKIHRKFDAYNDFKKKFESCLGTDGFKEFIDANDPEPEEFKKLLTKYTEIIRRMNVIKGILSTVNKKGFLRITSLDDFRKLVDDEKSLKPSYNVKDDIKEKIKTYIENVEKNIEYARSKVRLQLSLKGITGSLRHI